MAEEISQVLGFDASKAIEALNQLDKTMETFEQRLTSAASRFSFFNKEAGKTVAALIKIASSGKSAADSLHAVVTALSSPAQRDAAADARAAAAATDALSSSLARADLASRNASVKVGDALIKIGRQSKATSEEVQSSVQRMTTSLALLSRIVFTQFIVRGLSQLRNAFRATVGEAIEFQKSLALISTIDDTGQSLSQLSNTVRNVSDQFNIPLLETAAGLYQTISNQVGDVAESTQFLTEAAKFARTTNSSLENSVDLLSGAMKSYGLEVSDASRVSSIFFKTIDLGRIEANQLANAFGRVGPAAADLGVELEELNAALAAISVRGSKAPESLTQLRSIMTALTKPSVAMSKTLNELGFESAQLAIKTEGLAGILRLLVGSTEGSAEALARLFPNIRGLNGVAALTADEVLTLAKNTDEMSEAARDFTDKKYLQIIATDAEKVTAQINRLKNAFTVDLGQSLLKTAADFSELTGGLDNFTNIVKAAPPLVLGLGAAIALLGTKMTLTNVVATKLHASVNTLLGGLALIPAAIGAGTAIGNFIDTAAFDANFKALKDLRDANKKDLEEFTKSLQAETDRANQADKDRVKAVLQASKEISAAYLSQVNSARNANAALVANTSASLTAITDAFDKLTQAEASAAASALGIQNDSENRLQALQDRIADLDFEKRTKNLSDAQKALEITRRASQTAAEAARILSKAGGDQDKINRGLALFKQSESFVDQAKALGNQLDSADARRRIEQQTRTIVEQQIAAEKKLAKSQTTRIQNIQKERQNSQSILDAIREQSKIVKDNTGIFDSQGQQFSSAEQDKRAERRVAALQSIVDLTKKIDPTKLKELGLEDAVSKLQFQLTQDPLRLSLTVENETERIKKQLTDAFNDFSVQLKVETGVDVASLAQGLNLEAGSLNSPTAVTKALEKAAAEAKSIRDNLSNLETGKQQVADLRTEVEALLTKIQEGSGRRNRTGGNQETTAARDAFNLIEQRLRAVSSQSQIATADIEPLFLGLKAFNDDFQKAGVGTRTTFNTSLQAANQLLGVLNQISKVQTAQTESQPVDVLQQRLSVLDSLLGSDTAIALATNAQSAGNALNIGATSIIDATSASSTLEQNATRAGEALERGANRLIQASGVNFGNIPQPGGAANGLIKTMSKRGVLRHFANGGFASRGVDTVPTMLKPGESVINDVSTRRFFSQIQAMNAGQTPIFRENGGNVYNTVGDIHITGASNPEATADAVIRKINRAQRRGSSRLRG